MSNSILKTIMAVAVVVVTLIAGAAHAINPANKPAIDARGQTVIDARGNCVVTMWDGSNEKCDVTAISARYLSQTQRTVYFDFDSALIKPSAREQLRQVAAILRADQSVQQVNIVGFADRMGDAEYNRALSERRAKAVQQYLVSQGVVNTGQTELRWLGEDSPRTRCAESLTRAESIICLAPDRRVELQLQYNQ